MYSYNVSKFYDTKAFLKACALIEAGVSGYRKRDLIVDVDGTLLQIYYTGQGEITVWNDYEVGAVFVDSEVNLDHLNLSANW